MRVRGFGAAITAASCGRRGRGPSGSKYSSSFPTEVVTASAAAISRNLDAMATIGFLALTHAAATAFVCTPALISPRPHGVAVSRAAGASMAVDIPGSPKQIATEASLAVQRALKDGKRRLDVTVPDGLQFFGGVGAQQLGDPTTRIDQQTQLKADRELAYLVSEMFQGLGDGVACVLPEESMGIAEREWRKGGLQTRLVTSPKLLLPKGAKGAAGMGGFGGAKTAAKGSLSASSPLRVVILTRANKAMLSTLQPLTDEMGDEIVVVLVNPKRLKSGKGRPGYEPAFVLQDNPHPGWRGGFLYRPYPQKWQLGVAGSGGRPVIHGQSEARPTLEEIEIGFTKIKDDTSLVAGGAMAAVGVAAALERVGEGSMTFAGEVAAAARAASEEGKPPPEVLPGADKIRKFFGVDD